MSSGLALLLCVGLLASWGGCGGGVRPNVVLITLDTTRADHLGLYGYSRPTSPNLDALAAQSMVYERAYSTSSWTLPAHASLFTGKYPSSHGVQHDPQGELVLAEEVPGLSVDPRARSLSPGERTLAEMLRDAGYATAAVVGGPWLLGKLGLSAGFEHYDDDGAATPAGRPGDSVTDSALAWLDARKDGPFFLFLNYFDAHAPYDPPPAYAGAFLPPGRRPDPTLRAQEPALYDAEILYMDFEVGRLLRGLAERGLGDDTWVIVTGDHGELFGEHGWRGHERYLWEPLVRVPLIVHRPGAAPGRDERPVGLVDVFAMVLDAAGLEGPLAANAAGPLLAEVHPPSAAARSGMWRALWRGDRKTLWSSEGRLAQFDVLNDPGEQRDLLADDPEAKRRAAREISEAFGSLPPPEQRSDVEIDEQMRAALEALGYLE